MIKLEDNLGPRRPSEKVDPANCTHDVLYQIGRGEDKQGNLDALVYANCVRCETTKVANENYSRLPRLMAYRIGPDKAHYCNLYVRKENVGQ